MRFSSVAGREDTLGIALHIKLVKQIITLLAVLVMNTNQSSANPQQGCQSFPSGYLRLYKNLVMRFIRGVCYRTTITILSELKVYIY